MRTDWTIKASAGWDKIYDDAVIEAFGLAVMTTDGFYHVIA